VQTDVLILGCGIAGATTALLLAEDRQRQITLVTREDHPLESNSSYAQGGIVTAGDEDSPELLAEDVLRAGAGLSFPPAVELLAQKGPGLLRRILIDRAKLDFDKDEKGNVLFGLEGAHSRRRILHVGDSTGRAIMLKLLAEVAARPNIRVLTRHTAVDLITFPHHATRPLAVYEPLACHGAYVMQQDGGEVLPIVAAATVLATGGLGQIYLNTSNPAGARGDGLAMAYRAGARVINNEYVQFHPTTLHMPGPTKFLISEAVRGEGGVLLTPDGKPFIERYAPEWRELAPRDVVARAIYWEMLAHGYPYVLLDIASKKPADYIRKRFPEIHATCLRQNVDPAQQPIPVVPAAHDFCGGVMVDLWGRSHVLVGGSGLGCPRRGADRSRLGTQAACRQRDPSLVRRRPALRGRPGADPGRHGDDSQLDVALRRTGARRLPTQSGDSRADVAAAGHRGLLSQDAVDRRPDRVAQRRAGRVDRRPRGTRQSHEPRLSLPRGQHRLSDEFAADRERSTASLVDCNS
jgi:L-aspartate oxidase